MLPPGLRCSFSAIIFPLDSEVGTACFYFPFPFPFLALTGYRISNIPNY